MNDSEPSEHNVRGEMAADGIINLKVDDLIVAGETPTPLCFTAVHGFFFCFFFLAHVSIWSFVSKQNLKVRSPKDSKDQTSKNSLEGQ